MSPEFKSTSSEDGAVCPYCNHVNNADGYDYELYDTNTDEWECDGCKRKFTVNVILSHWWECGTMEEREYWREAGRKLSEEIRP